MNKRDMKSFAKKTGELKNMISMFQSFSHKPAILSIYMISAKSEDPVILFRDARDVDELKLRMIVSVTDNGQASVVSWYQSVEFRWVGTVLELSESGIPNPKDQGAWELVVRDN